MSHKAIYPATRQGYEKYCKGCSELVKVEDIKDRPPMYPYRVFCRVEKCIK